MTTAVLAALLVGAILLVSTATTMPADEPLTWFMVLVGVVDVVAFVKLMRDA